MNCCCPHIWSWSEIITLSLMVVAVVVFIVCVFKYTEKEFKELSQPDHEEIKQHERYITNLKLVLTNKQGKPIKTVIQSQLPLFPVELTMN